MEIDSANNRTCESICTPADAGRFGRRYGYDRFRHHHADRDSYGAAKDSEQKALGG